MIERVVGQPEFLFHFAQFRLAFLELLLLLSDVWRLLLLHLRVDVVVRLLMRRQSHFVRFQEVEQVLSVFHVRRLRLPEHVTHLFRRRSPILRSAEFTVAPV